MSHACNCLDETAQRAFPLCFGPNYPASNASQREVQKALQDDLSCTHKQKYIDCPACLVRMDELFLQERLNLWTIQTWGEHQYEKCQYLSRFNAPDDKFPPIAMDLVARATRDRDVLREEYVSPPWWTGIWPGLTWADVAEELRRWEGKVERTSHGWTTWGSNPAPEPSTVMREVAPSQFRFALFPGACAFD